MATAYGERRPGLAWRLRPRGWAIVTLGFAAAAVMCGWAIYLDLAGLISRAAFGYALVFAFVPVVPMVAGLLWLDRVRPEPTPLIVIALLWGALAAAYFALQINGWLSREVGDEYSVTARSAVFVAPWVEEAMKGAIVFALVWWRRHDFNAIRAGIVYAGLAGVGFAFTENIVYYGQLFQRVKDYNGSQHVALDAVERLFLWRGVASPFVHPMFTALTGIGIGLAVLCARRTGRILLPVAGYCCAVGLHMAYNAVAIRVEGAALGFVYGFVLLPLLAALVAFALWVRRRELQIVEQRLLDYTEFGWLSPETVAAVAVPSVRRAAYRQARKRGRAGRSALRRLQLAGCDLGVLRDRQVRGVAGPDTAYRERELIDAVRSAAERVPIAHGPGPARLDLTRAGSSW